MHAHERIYLLVIRQLLLGALVNGPRAWRINALEFKRLDEDLVFSVADASGGFCCCCCSWCLLRDDAPPVFFCFFLTGEEDESSET